MSGSISLGLYDTAEMVAVVRNLKLPSTFLSRKFFPNVVEHNTVEFAIGVDAPGVPGKPSAARLTAHIIAAHTKAHGGRA
jgi:hypothetical protein